MVTLYGLSLKEKEVFRLVVEYRGHEDLQKIQQLIQGEIK